MDRVILTGAILLIALGVTVVPLWADTISVPLKPMEIPDSTNAMAQLAVRRVAGQAGGHPTLRVPPKGISRQATYFSVQVAGKSLLMAMEYSRSASKLYVDGKCVARSSEFRPEDYNLTNRAPLRIGFGQHDYFHGILRDLRIYRRALSDGEIAGLRK